MATWHDRLAALVTRSRADDGGLRYIMRFAVLVAAVWIALSGLSSLRKSSVEVEQVASAHAMVRAIGGERPAGGKTGYLQSPGYPIVLAGIALVTPGTLEAMSCWVTKQPEACRAGGLGFVIAIQIGIALAIFLLAFRIVHVLSERRDVAFLAVLLAFFTVRVAEFAGTIRSGVWYPFLILLALALLLDAARRDKPSLALGAGVVVGLATLFEPVTAILVPVIAVQLYFNGVVEGRPASPAVRIGVAMAFVGGAVVACGGLLWLAMSGHYDISALWGRIATALAKRLAFVGLERSTWLAAVVVPIPLVGDLIGGLLPPAELQKLAIGTLPGSLAHHGASTLLHEAIHRAGNSMSSATGLLAGELVVGRPVAAALSFPPVLMRGLIGGAGVIGLVGLFHVPRMLRYARAEGRGALHCLVVVPAFALLLANALLTSNEFWLNPILPFLYTYAIVYVAGGW